MLRLGAKVVLLAGLFAMGLAAGAGGSPGKFCRTTTVYVTTTVRQISTVVSTVTQTVTSTVTVTQPGTTTTAPPTSPGGGWGLVQYGGSLGNVSVAHRQAARMVIVSPCCGDPEIAAALPGRSLVYTDPTCIQVNGGSGLDYNAASRNGYLTGETNPDFGCANTKINDPGYQQWYAQQVVALAKTAGVDGIFADNIGGYLKGYTTLSYSQIQDADVALTKAAGDALHANGLYFLTNTNGYQSGNSASDDGTLDLAWWERIAPNVDGVMSESWAETRNGSNTLRLRGTDSWTKFWDQWEAAVQQFHADFPSKDFVPLTYGDDAHLIYGRASLMLADPAGIFFGHRPGGDDSDPYGPWTADGTPSVDPVVGTATIN